MSRAISMPIFSKSDSQIGCIIGVSVILINCYIIDNAVVVFLGFDEKCRFGAFFHKKK